MDATIDDIDVWGADEICRFLDAYPNIRQTYAHLLVSGDVIACLLRLLERKRTDLDELVKLYCQSGFIHEKYAALDDAGDVEDKRVALQRVFIDLDAKPPTLPQDQQTLERLPEWLKQAAEDGDRVSALSYLLDDSIPGLVLVGGPGEGKSTLCQYLAQIHRALLIGKLHELGENGGVFEICFIRVPFRILLREYAQWIASQSNSDSLFHYLALQVPKESGRATNLEDIHKIMKASPTLLILDGLDEISEKNLRTKVLDNVTSFVDQVRNILGGDLRVVATTRPYGYSEEFDPSHYLHLTLQKLSFEKAGKYAARWVDAREPDLREATRIRGTFDLCLKDKVVSVLTKSPLQVTILLVIIRARGTPPKQCEELFERYTDIIYQREQKKRPELLRTEPDVIYGLHKYLAYILHRRAERDETAAIMDMSEFKERLKEYLIHTNSLLTKREVEAKAEQIITEASQRLVLIESPQEGKVGFGLATTREFFAAAHLVDTAKDTKERDLRFRAIARSPHWRHAALFFAGRVGRTRPGEAPSMIDICREIDTERVDKFLKRGAELVMEMVDDRVLREPYNEIGAIQYGLTLIDKEYVEKSDELLNKLKNLPAEYKERIIRPWMEERLKNVIPENLDSYTDIYQILFGVSEPLHEALKRASKSSSEDVKLWALSQAIKDKIVETWVIELLEELAESIPSEKIIKHLGIHWPNFKFYLNFPLSSKARIVIACSLLSAILEEISPFEPLSSEVIDGLSLIKPEGKFKKNSLLLWAVSQFLMLPISVVTEHRLRDFEIRLPSIVNPHVKTLIDKNIRFIKDFCETFSDDNEPFIKFLLTLLEFLLQPDNVEKYIDISKQLQDEKIKFLELKHLVYRILGSIPEDEETLYSCHKDLYTLYELYKSEEEYRKDIEVLNEIVNKNSKTIKKHPQKLHIWIISGCDSNFEKYLDKKILKELKSWLEKRFLSYNALNFGWSIVMKSDLELCELCCELAEKKLADGQEKFFDSMIAYYDWQKPKSKQESEVANRLKCIFEYILANYTKLKDPEHFRLEFSYISALRADVVEEKHLSQLYQIINDDPNFLHPWIASKAKSAWSTLIKMLKSDNMEVARLAALTLIRIIQGEFRYERRIKETWIGDKYWAFTQDKEDKWQSKYIQGMAQCQLKWSEKGEEWFEAITGADAVELQNAWSQVIVESGYCDANDRDALFKLLLHILESGDTFAKPIRTAALRRLHRIIYEVESQEFDEKSLNLPLSQRVRTSFS